MDRWFVYVEKNVWGPFSTQAVQKYIEKNQDKNLIVWGPYLDKWLSASDWQELIMMRKIDSSAFAKKGAEAQKEVEKREERAEKRAEKRAGLEDTQITKVLESEPDHGMGGAEEQTQTAAAPDGKSVWKEASSSWESAEQDGALGTKSGSGDTKSFVEHRNSLRVPLNGVLIFNDGRRAQVQDISAGGISVFASSLTLNFESTVSAMLQSASIPPIKLELKQVEPARDASKGVGFGFCRMKKSDYDLVLAYLHQHSAAS